MDDIEKSRVRLIHWIEHNLEHVKGYNEVAQILQRDGFHSASEKIRRGVSLIEAANEEFETALAGLSAPGARRFRLEARSVTQATLMNMVTATSILTNTDRDSTWRKDGLVLYFSNSETHFRGSPLYTAGVRDLTCFGNAQ